MPWFQQTLWFTLEIATGLISQSCKFLFLMSILLLKSLWKWICKMKKLNVYIMNRNIRDQKLSSYMRPLLQVHISSGQVHGKVLMYLKLLKMVYVSILEFNISKCFIKLWSMPILDFWQHAIDIAVTNI